MDEMRISRRLLKLVLRLNGGEKVEAVADDGTVLIEEDGKRFEFDRVEIVGTEAERGRSLTTLERLFIRLAPPREDTKTWAEPSEIDIERTATILATLDDYYPDRPISEIEDDTRALEYIRRAKIVHAKLVAPLSLVCRALVDRSDKACEQARRATIRMNRAMEREENACDKKDRYSKQLTELANEKRELRNQLDKAVSEINGTTQHKNTCPACRAWAWTDAQEGDPVARELWWKPGSYVKCEVCEDKRIIAELKAELDLALEEVGRLRTATDSAIAALNVPKSGPERTPGASPYAPRRRQDVADPQPSAVKQCEA